ncbi:ATP-dependent DNA helicase [Trichonephila clavata]|uniref:ATP-dependent DNA helicase n=1 Tax=Trichonephila clavata TaxID=2740835 RepID=A0A8X6HS06_TRICU|nr:ATP-dependent DNA helicase [Trichonephila clavata]
MPTFKVQGQIYHRIGSIFPCPAEEPKFLQIYFIDSNTEQAEQRCKIVQQVKQDLVLKLQDMLQRNNSYIKSFKSAIEKLGPDFRIIIYADKVPADVGQLIILPSSFMGSPRYMHEHTQDAMTYVRNYGRPDLFITFTCNPAWSEIANELFLEGNAAERARFAPETTLTAFFRICNEDEFARTLFNHQFPRYYTWDSKNKKWSPRKVGQSLSDYPGIKSTDAIGRVYTVHPNNSECFHLRLLLHEVPGPTSFQYLKTFEGRICSNYKEACQVRGLLENDEHWNATLEEDAFMHSPRMLRDLFAVML